MNTQSIHWEQCNNPPLARPRGPVLSFYYFMDQSLKYITSAVCAFAVLFGAVLAISNPSLVLYVQAIVYTAGLLFFGLAIEAEKTSTAWFCVATGLTLPALAYMCRVFGTEWLIVAAGLVSVWVAAGIIQLTRTARR